MQGSYLVLKKKITTQFCGYLAYFHNLDLQGFSAPSFLAIYSRYEQLKVKR